MRPDRIVVSDILEITFSWNNNAVIAPNIVPIIIVFPGIPVLPGSVIVLCIAPRTVAYTN